MGSGGVNGDESVGGCYSFIQSSLSWLSNNSFFYMIAGSCKKMAAEEKIGHGKTSTKNNPCSMKNQNSLSPLKNAFL